MTIPGSSTTAPPIITINWSTVTLDSTTGISTATHDSHGWPIIPVLHCWFCPPGGGSDGGIIIPGVTGPGILPPPSADVESSLGFSTNMPSITLDSQGDPTYSSEPTSNPTTKPTTSASSSSSATCTASSTVTDCVTETIYSTLIFASSMSSSTTDFSTSVSTTTTKSCSTVIGCSVTGTTATTSSAIASTTMEGQSCAVNASASISSLYASAFSAAVTVVSGTTIPLAFYAETATDGLTVASFGFNTSSTSASSPLPSSSSVSTDPSTSRSSTLSTSSSSSTTVGSATSASRTTMSSGSSTVLSPTSATSSAASAAATWELTAYDTSCDDRDSDFSYYTLRGTGVQSVDETCLVIQSNLPMGVDGDTCEFFEDGGFDGPKSCSSGTFSQPKSFVIRNGFCTIHHGTDCAGGAYNGADSEEFSGCTNVHDAFLDLEGWGSIQCFAYTDA
ncbi:hypothetical protein VP1G_10694 [Cytospora mali]|uniref:Secreted LysM effector LysM C-terminal domain-containing protein n=1 Tax=Cytospora mali TaxID=578113 RepID=A0A194USK4_CYTMA|nr:hypothetical protein VP1G_10694 [Valsa mali var. pyri (nom. inval.)]